MNHVPGEEQQCPLCGLGRAFLEKPSDQDARRVVCRRCGTFLIAGDILLIWKGMEVEADDKRLRSFLPAYTRQASVSGSEAVLDRDNWRGFAGKHADTAFPQKTAKFLEILKSHSHTPGDVVTINGDFDYPLVDAVSLEEFNFLAKYLKEKNLVDLVDGGDQDSLRKYRLTGKSWESFDAQSGLPNATPAQSPPQFESGQHDILPHPSSTQSQIFLSYAREDIVMVRELHRKLSDAGFTPWMDKVDLLPGQRWDLEIPKALRASGFILIFFSQHSVAKRGYVQREFKLALDTLEEIPEGYIHTIPIRLEDCEIPDQFSNLQWVDLSEEGSFERIVRALRAGLSQRQSGEREPGSISAVDREEKSSSPSGLSMSYRVVKDYEIQAGGKKSYDYKVILGVQNTGPTSVRSPHLSVKVSPPYGISSYGIDGNMNHGLPIRPSHANDGWVHFDGGANTMINPGTTFDVTAIKGNITAEDKSPHNISLSYEVSAEDYPLQTDQIEIKDEEIRAAIFS